MFTVKRSEHNPILSPIKNHPWEAAASFNGCPIKKGKETILLYRAMSDPELMKEPHIGLSSVGIARSTDGVTFGAREQLIVPDQDFDKYGCEDPRITKLGKTYYIFYTALGGYPFNADCIKVAVATSTDLKKIDSKHLVTPFDAKGMALFPEKIQGKMAAILTVNTDRPPSEICYVEFDKESDLWSPEFWKSWQNNLSAHALPIRRKPDDHLEVGAPPIKTKKGWLVIYSHIQKYGSSHQVFGIEAVLLDLKDPRKVIGRTAGPFLIPEQYYEQMGMVPNITFPSGAMLSGNELTVYYGAADTHCACATIPLDNLLNSMINGDAVGFSRYAENPIIAPRPGVEWEKMGTLNPAAIELGGKIHILYRAVSGSNVSTIGYAVSRDGFSLDERLPDPIYVPRADFERRGGETTNFGCEDPRIVEIKGYLYLTYTAYNGAIPRVAVSSISVTDFLARKWDAWSMPIAITPPGVDDKDSTILPGVVHGKYLVIHRAASTICADYIKSLDFSKETINECIKVLLPRRGMWDGEKVGVAAPPIKTKKGWLMLYHGVSWSTIYRVGAVLLDLSDPTIVLARTAAPIFEPQTDYERNGIVANVVFPCGLIVRKGTVYIYYGAADKTVGVATIKLATLLSYLKLK